MAGPAIASASPAGLAADGAVPVPAQRSDFEFALPPELIAQHPPRRREAARLLHVLPDRLQDGSIPDMIEKFQAGDVLVLNDTRVIKARLHGEKESGGRVEALVERILTGRCAQVLLRTSHAPRPGLRLRFHPGTGEVPGPAHAPPAAARPAFVARVLGRHDDLFTIEFDAPIEDVLAAVGQLPLPPYIRHAPQPQDEERYQTVYARAPGAVAAPTAGLHLSDELLARLRARGVRIAFITLHVGAGTFQPVRAQRLADHRMHSERYCVPPETATLVNEARGAGRQVIAVGTTSVRALESSVRDGRVHAGSGETSLFILPGFGFQCVDRLVTNFHLPGSTLLMLASAFAGTARVRQAYRHAVAARYRFFSYGDAMLLERAA